MKESESASRSFSEENDIQIRMLEEQFNDCNLKVFQKESPMNDDNIDGWLEIVQQYYLNSSKSSYLSFAKLFPLEFEAIRKLLSYHDHLIHYHEMEIFCGQSTQYFFKCISMKYCDYSKIANLVKVKRWVRAADELRECISNFQSFDTISNREEFFKYRLNWLISLVGDGLQFDNCIELGNDIKINYDICIDSVNINRRIYIMFANSNMEDAFNCEEFSKTIILTLLSTASFGKSTSSFICCKTFAYHFFFGTYFEFCISKIDLTNVKGILELFCEISHCCNRGRAMHLFEHARYELERKEKTGIKGIEKTNKTSKLNNTNNQSQKKVLILGNISNLLQNKN